MMAVGKEKNITVFALYYSNSNILFQRYIIFLNEDTTPLNLKSSNSKERQLCVWNIFFKKQNKTKTVASKAPHKFYPHKNIFKNISSLKERGEECQILCIL